MENEMENKTEGKPTRKINIWITIIIGLIVVAILAAVWASFTFNTFSQFPFRPLQPTPYNPADLEVYYILRTVFSTINIALLVFLIATYATLYVKTRSEFTIGLLIFAVVFVIRDVLSSPFVIGAFRFHIAGLGPFALIEPVFETAALSVLLYLSVKY